MNFDLDKIYIRVYTVYYRDEVINFMDTAKVFKNGKSQAVRLPKKFRFRDNEEIIIKKIGEIVYLCPKDKADEIFFSSLGKFDDSVFEAIEEIRKDYVYSVREEL